MVMKLGIVRALTQAKASFALAANRNLITITAYLHVIVQRISFVRSAFRTTERIHPHPAARVSVVLARALYDTNR